MRGCCTCAGHTTSGAQAERKGLLDALTYVRAGDMLVVWKLDRLGRSLKDLITRITELNNRKIGFKSLTEQIEAWFRRGRFWVTDAARKPPARDGWISLRRRFCREAVNLPGVKRGGAEVARGPAASANVDGLGWSSIPAGFCRSVRHVG